MINNLCESSGCLQTFLKNIINTTVISVDHIGVVPWCIIWWFIWFFIRSIYKKCFQGLLKKISMSEEHSQELIRLYWSIAFTSITVPFAMHHLKLSYSDLTDRFYYVLENHISRWFLSDPMPSVQAKLSYVITAGFYLNSICDVCFEYGIYSKEFIINELFGLFFIATFPLRCVQYGLAVTTIVNVVDFFLLLSNLFSCFCDIAQTKSLRVLVYVFLFLHSLLWFFAYLYILPMYFMTVAIKKMKLATDVRQIAMYILLNCSLFGYYLLVLIISPVSTMTASYIRGTKLTFTTSKNIENNECLMEHKEEVINCLIENNEEVIDYLIENKEEVIDPLMESKEEARRKRQKKKENLLMLYNTIKCVICIKRKLARMRQDKKTEAVMTPDDSLCKDENIQETAEEVTENDSVVENIPLFSTENDEEASENNCTEDLQFSDNDYLAECDEGEYSLQNCRDLSRDDLQVELTH